nr:uncharacterized protein LOC113693486 [Coffea arabica]
MAMILAYIRRCVLQDINRSLEQMGKHIGDYHLPDSKSFFVDGPRETGKTILYHALLATLRTQGYIALPVTSFGVAASILLAGRTTYSRFKIPLDASIAKTCQISKQSSTAKLIFMAKLILWDEASMAKRETIEAFDLLLKDIMDSDKPFGSKVMVFGSDFRQTLPVIQNATRDIQVQASFVNSTLWGSLQKVSLIKNMRAFLDKSFLEFLLRVGEGTEPENEDGRISLSNNILVPYDNKDSSLDRLCSNSYLLYILACSAAL